MKNDPAREQIAQHRQARAQRVLGLLGCRRCRGGVLRGRDCELGLAVALGDRLAAGLARLGLASVDALRADDAPGFLGCGTASSTLAQQELEQRLLGVAAVLGLVPDALALAVEHLGGDLLAGVGREAVQRDRARRRASRSASSIR